MILLLSEIVWESSAESLFTLVSFADDVNDSSKGIMCLLVWTYYSSFLITASLYDIAPSSFLILFNKSSWVCSGLNTEDTRSVFGIFWLANSAFSTLILKSLGFWLLSTIGATSFGIKGYKLRTFELTADFWLSSLFK